MLWQALIAAKGAQGRWIVATASVLNSLALNLCSAEHAGVLAHDESCLVLLLYK